MHNERNRTLDSIKGIGILLVLITHFSWSVQERGNLIFLLVINMAVPIFMIISGYTYSLSFEKKNVIGIEDAYKCRIIIPKILRYTIPFLFVVIWEMIDNHVYLSAAPPSVITVIRWFLRGMVGHGSYYYPILLQMVFLFPIIYFIVARKKQKGLWICFFINIAYEILKWAYGISEDTYRLIALRYIFLIAIGAYAFVYKNELNLNKFIVFSFIGLSFIILYHYFNYIPEILSYWTSTCVIASMWIIPFVLFALKHRIHLPVVEILGRASYHIFLVQMVYYEGYHELLNDFTPNRIIYLLLAICICSTIGVLFYYIDRILFAGLYRIANKHQTN